jgi:hypothetical protein
MPGMLSEWLRGVWKDRAIALRLEIQRACDIWGGSLLAMSPVLSTQFPGVECRIASKLPLTRSLTNPGGRAHPGARPESCVLGNKWDF